MPTAILRIDGDASGLSRVFGDIKAQAKAAAAEVKAAFSGAFDGAARSAAGAASGSRRAGRTARDESARTAAQQERDSQRTIAAFLRAEDQKRRAARTTAAARQRAEGEATSIARAEAQKRGLTAEQEARVRQGALERLTRVHEAEERRMTAASAREAKRRYDDVRNGVRRGLTQGAGSALNFARNAHSEIQDVRQRRAGAERAVSLAVLSGGGSASEAAAARSQVTAFAAARGMSTADVAQALDVGQARGSALEGATPAARAAALQSALGTIREANAAGVDPGQLLSARGRLSQLGLHGDNLQGALRYTMQAAARGSVEVDQIIQQGLPGAARLMTQRGASLGPGATPEAVERARLQAFQESVAVQEIAASTGRTPGNTSNTLASLNSFLRTPRRQEAILNNIRVAEGQINTSTPEGAAQAQRFRELRESMFERDPTRTGNAMRMRAGFSPLEFASRLTQATGGDANRATSILAGGGHGNPQSLLSNMRELTAFLGTEGGRVTAMMQGGGMSNADMAMRQRVVEGDTQSQLARAQEQHDNALGDNTSSLNQLSNAFASFTAAHPLASMGVSALGNVAGQVVAGRVATGVAGALTGGAAAGGGGGLLGALSTGATALGAAKATGLASLAGAGGLGATLASSVGAVGAGTLGAAVVGSLGAGLGAGYGINRAMGHNQQSDNPLNAAFYREFAQSVRDALEGATITATVSPVDATHAAAQAPVTR